MDLLPNLATTFSFSFFSRKNKLKKKIYRKILKNYTRLSDERCQNFFLTETINIWIYQLFIRPSVFFSLILVPENFWIFFNFHRISVFWFLSVSNMFFMRFTNWFCIFYALLMLVGSVFWDIYQFEGASPQNGAENFRHAGKINTAGEELTFSSKLF